MYKLQINKLYTGTNMRVVALISGGKDSCYNMMQCIAAGHDIVALANLKPQSKGKYFIFKLIEFTVR